MRTRLRGMRFYDDAHSFAYCSCVSSSHIPPRRCPNPRRSLGMALGRPVEQAVLSFLRCSGRLERWPATGGAPQETVQGPARPRQSRRSVRTNHTEFTSDMGF